MTRHTAHVTPWPHHYSVKDPAGDLIATLAPASKDVDIMRICWFGGERHGKTDLAKGGLQGAMEFIGAAH